MPRPFGRSEFDNNGEQQKGWCGWNEQVRAKWWVARFWTHLKEETSEDLLMIEYEKRRNQKNKT